MVEKKIDRITNFYRKTDKVVIWRDDQRRMLLNKYDNKFYKWARYLNETQKAIENSYRDYTEDEKLAIKRAKQCLDSALVDILVNGEYTTYNIIQRRINGNTEEEMRCYYSYLSKAEYTRYETEGIAYIQNKLEANGIKING